MKTRSADNYAIAFPRSYEKKVKNLPWLFCKKNRLSVFLVDGNKVSHITWRELKDREREKRRLSLLKHSEPTNAKRPLRLAA